MESLNIENKNSSIEKGRVSYVEFLENHGIKKNVQRKYLHQLNESQNKEFKEKFSKIYNKLEHYQENGMDKIGFGSCVYFIDDNQSIFAIEEIHDSQDPKTGITLSVIDKDGKIEEFEQEYDDKLGEDLEDD